MGGKILNYPTKENFYAARAEGRKEGLAEGRREHLEELVEKMLKKGFSVPEITEILDEKPEVIAEIMEKAEIKK